MSHSSALLSNPGLALTGACFDLEDLQAICEDYEERIKSERQERERAESQLRGLLARAQELEGELGKLKNIVAGALAKGQRGPVAEVPAPVYAARPSPAATSPRRTPAPTPMRAVNAMPPGTAVSPGSASHTGEKSKRRKLISRSR